MVYSFSSILENMSESPISVNFYKCSYSFLLESKQYVDLEFDYMEIKIEIGKRYSIG